MDRKNTMDMTKGSVTKQILLFAVPIMLGNILQQLYNIADRVVVGRFAENGEIGLAAIGATSSAIFLFVSLFTGMGVGTNVLCANLLGARNEKDLRKGMHTAVLFALICGIFVGAAGVLLTGEILRLLGTPAEISALAALYKDAPFSVLYTNPALLDEFI